MTKWGIIGIGNMGGMLLETWINTGAVKQEDVIIYNRTKTKTELWKERYPEIITANNDWEVAQWADFTFLCVRPPQIPNVIASLKKELSFDKCIVSITSPFSVKQLEEAAGCQVARAIPSITNKAAAGSTLTTFGSSMTRQNRAIVLDLISSYSSPVYITEDVTRVSSDIVSCGPAFFAYLAKQFAEAAVAETSIDRDQAMFLTSEMLIGLGKLLESGSYSLDQLIEKVCVKGGITGKGIEVMEEQLEGMFNKVYQATHLKYNTEKDHLTTLFQQKP